jgi:dihydrofolate reductase
MIFEKISGIAACDPRGVIGRNGKLPWHCPEDLKHFSDTIFSYPIIMGYKTFLSLPASYLEERTVIDFTRQKFSSYEKSRFFFVSSLAEFFALEGVFKELYVIGGAQIYELFFKQNLMKEFILTRMKSFYDGDTFFPLSSLQNWPCFRSQETDLFSVERYFNPREIFECIIPNQT